jgi:selenophosphate synthetase-related protein
MRSEGSLQSAPEDAMVVDIQLERGDTVLLATDGLYDNLFDHVCDQRGDQRALLYGMLTRSMAAAQDIEKVLHQHLGSEPTAADVRAAVQELVAHAARVAKGETHLSPFAKGARALGYNVLGGKVDDVCAILVRVS